MDNPIMFRSRLMSMLIASVIGSSFGNVLPAGAADGNTEGGAGPVQLTQACGTYGPYATIRRANEVAYEAAGLGYSTAVFHNGDGYYVRACLARRPARSRHRRLGTNRYDLSLALAH